MVRNRSLALALGLTLAAAVPAVGALDPTTPQLRANADFTWTAPDTGQQTGLESMVVGDVNGDGRDDIAVNQLAPPTSAFAGEPPTAFKQAELLPGRPGPGVVKFGIPGSQTVSLGESDDRGIGVITGLGDVDGDGFDDIAHRPNVLGAIDIVFGARDIFAPLRRVRITTGTESMTDERIGANAGIGPAGDVDGDGIADILLGRKAAAGGLEFVVVPGRAGLAAFDLASPPAGSRTISEPANSSYVDPDRDGLFSGSAIARAVSADITADGLSDVVIARDDRNDPTATVLHVIAGANGAVGDSGLEDAPQIVVRGVTASLDLGTGDANGDGTSDVIVADSLKKGSVAIYGRSDLLNPTSADPNLDTGILAAGVDAGATTQPYGEWIPDRLSHERIDDFDVVHGGAPGGVAFESFRLGDACGDGFSAESSGVIYRPSSPGGAERTIILPGSGGLSTGDINGDGVEDLVVSGLPFTRVNLRCPAREKQVKVVFGARLPVCAGPQLPDGAGLENLARGASLRRARRADITATVGQLRANQRIAADAIRRLNAVREWLDGGIEGRDICGDALGAKEFAPGTTAAPAPLAERTAPNPRPVVVAEPQNGVAEMTVSPRQLLINQRIYQAAIARANALGERMAALTGGDVKDGSITVRGLRGDLAVSGGSAPAQDASVTTIVPPTQRPLNGLKVTPGQLLVNHRIALEVQLRAQNMQARLEQGLIGENFADGSLTPVDLG